MWAYLNGQILKEDQAFISPLDRGFTFGDGVYEGIPCYAGKLFLFEDHLKRLLRRLGVIGLWRVKLLKEIKRLD